MTKATWLGQDIDTLSREQLIEIIHTLDRQLTDARMENAGAATFMAELFKYVRKLKSEP